MFSTLFLWVSLASFLSCFIIRPCWPDHKWTAPSASIPTWHWIYAQYASPLLHMQIKSDHEDQMPWCFFSYLREASMHWTARSWRGKQKKRNALLSPWKVKEKLSVQIKTTSSWPGCLRHSLRIIMGSSEFSVAVDKASSQALRNDKKIATAFVSALKQDPKGILHTTAILYVKSTSIYLFSSRLKNNNMSPFIGYGFVTISCLCCNSIQKYHNPIMHLRVVCLI